MLIDLVTPPLPIPIPMNQSINTPKPYIYIYVNMCESLSTVMGGFIITIYGRSQVRIRIRIQCRENKFCGTCIASACQKHKYADVRPLCLRENQSMVLNPCFNFCHSICDIYTLLKVLHLIEKWIKGMSNFSPKMDPFKS